MKISLKAPYKSLEPFENDDLPNFCLITGKNGSGKSQLIELIQAKRDNQNLNFDLDVDRSRIQIEGINHPSSNSLDSGLLNSRISEYWTQYSGFRDFMIPIQILYERFPDLNLHVFEFPELLKLILENVSDEVKIALANSSVFLNRGQVEIGGYVDEAARQIFYKKDLIGIARDVIKKSRKNFNEISYQDFVNFPPEEKFVDRKHLFHSSIEIVFYSYAKRRHLNYMHWIANREFAKSYECQSDQEFLQKYPPPWSTINAIFKKHGINYSFEEISPENFIENIPIDFKLIKNSTSKRIEFNNLSSGEKIIIGLIVKLFPVSFYGKELETPELIVLDEPDSHLHPELSKLLIEVLSDTFVNDLGIRVLMTTHSPSTVALAPEQSIFELKNEPSTSIKKISKDEALKLLTFGVPHLSIDYKNHRQIFVESPTDVAYFQAIYNVISLKEKFSFKPYFISYSKGKGNCDQVYALVTNLRTAGNDKVFGIVDWDAKRTNEEFVFVHGENLCYSVENFIYNPIYLVEFFLEIKGAESVFSELKFAPSYNQYSLGSESHERLQEISDWVLNKIRVKFPTLKTQDMTVFEFWNGKIIRLPKWYMEMKGHELETKLKKVFPSLDGKFRAEGQMQEDLAKIIAKSFPFIPLETANLIKKLVE
jgi:ABC-type ATPase involved in cell division